MEQNFSKTVLNNSKRKIFVSFFIFAVAFAYAVIRYNIIKGVPFENLPLFIFNKAISFAVVIFIAFSYLLGYLERLYPEMLARWDGLKKFFGVLGFGFAAAHGVMSLLLFNASYYPKFFAISGKLNAVGELSMLFGVLSMAIFSVVAVASLPAVESAVQPEKWRVIQRLGYLAFFFTMLHVAVMGFEGWLAPATWPGGLLPISLIAFIIIFTTLLLRVGEIIFKQR